MPSRQREVRQGGSGGRGALAHARGGRLRAAAKGARLTGRADEQVLSLGLEVWGCGAKKPLCCLGFIFLGLYVFLGIVIIIHDT